MGFKTLSDEIVSLRQQINRRCFSRNFLNLSITTLIGLGFSGKSMAAETEGNTTSTKPAELPFPIDKGDDNPLLNTHRVHWKVSNGELMHGYIAVPAVARGKLPAVMVVHDENGLDFEAREVARQMALKGYIALAPDFLSPWGGTPKDTAKAKAMIGAFDMPWVIKDAVMTIAWLKNQRYSTGKVGAIGLGWGGKLVEYTAAQANTDLLAAVTYYSPSPPVAEAAKIKTPLQLHFGTMDQKIDVEALDWIEALKAASVPLECYFYPNSGHGFMDETQTNYNQAASQQAWARSTEFLAKYLEPKPALLRKIEKDEQKQAKNLSDSSMAPATPEKP
ncbi:carboxymethylenebutenolidase [Zymomonas mobilis subsp. pomaceae]|uniref:Carboxymethylenebutenolidase n=2 Tax=Zymomonas mobilis TaxID=542 RepID=F8ESU5_ZYMMT|nr:Carboxymethylenebutenolidase [Zymomonas mobilis subsp. pomaceae ATCC 29192]GEB89038.1 carboxymethylenebutenolidase [Zymomonas mobilis subsp. pomaceae]